MVDVAKGEVRPEEEPEIPKNRKEKDTEANDELPYTIKTSDVIGRSVTSWADLQYLESFVISCAVL
jgi:hypothetical protein